MTTSHLDAALLKAHAAADRRTLAALYETAADQAADPDAEGFFLTQAMVFAMEAGDSRADFLRARLCASGRELPAQGPF